MLVNPQMEWNRTVEQITFQIRGIAPCLMQSDKLSNPLDPLKREQAKLTSKRGNKKTEDDIAEIMHIDYLGSFYYTKELGPYWPGQNIERMLRDAAKLTREGKDIERGVSVLDPSPLQYNGPRTPETLYKDPNFVDVRSVVVQGKRVMRCRPIFREWEVEFTATYDPSVVDRESLIRFCETAGRVIGLSTYRPRFGRFEVVSTH